MHLSAYRGKKPTTENTVKNRINNFLNNKYLKQN